MEMAGENESNERKATEKEQLKQRELANGYHVKTKLRRGQMEE